MPTDRNLFEALSRLNLDLLVPGGTTEQLAMEFIRQLDTSLALFPTDPMAADLQALRNSVAEDWGEPGDSDYAPWQLKILLLNQLDELFEKHPGEGRS